MQLWFYIATIVTVAILHVFNSLALPFGPLNSYSIYAAYRMPSCNGGTDTMRWPSS